MLDLCFNYVFERDGRAIFYGMDSSYTFPLTLEFLRRFKMDVAVLDVTFGRREIDPVKSGHHNIPMIKETIAEFREAGIFDDKTTIVASHMALAYAEPYDDLIDEMAAAGITLGYDGIELDV